MTKMSFDGLESGDPTDEKILWSAISRNGTILVEAGDDPFEGAVSQTAQGILCKKTTPGWEYFTLKNGDGYFSSLKNSDGWFGLKSVKSDAPPAQPRVPKLKAVKFHLFEHSSGDSSCRENFDSAPNVVGGTREPTVWVFAAVYNPEASGWAGSKHVLSDVQSFIEKIVGLTEMPRQADPVWRTGGTLSCQASFAAILLQRMQEVTYLGAMARLTESLDGATEMMQNNITAILDNEDKIRNMEEKTSKLEEMAGVFKKNTKVVRRRMMMQNAKHGIILGTAITAGVAVIVVPPLIAIL